MRKLFYLCVLLACPALTWGQGVRVDNPAGPATRNVQNFLSPIPGASITVCTSAGSGTPCTPVVPTSPVTLCTDSTCSVAAPNPFLADTNGNWGAYLLPGTYKVSITAPGVTGQLITVTLPPTPGANTTYTGSNTFTQQIISTVVTGTAPFSIASTTAVPNLNAQLHNGLTAPASAIVGISDSQTLTNKTLTSPTINTPTLDGTGAAHVASQVSAVTNFGTALGSQTIIASMPSTGSVSLLFLIVQVTAGVGCSAATNSVTVNPVTWTAPGGTVENINPSSNMGFNGNGVVDSGSSTFGSSAFTNNGIQGIVAKSGTSVSYTTTSTLASTGCSTVPQYVVYVKAIF